MILQDLKHVAFADHFSKLVADCGLANHLELRLADGAEQSLGDDVQIRGLIPPAMHPSTKIIAELCELSC